MLYSFSTLIRVFQCLMALSMVAVSLTLPGAIALAQPAGPERPLMPSADLVEKLQSGGNIMLIRHERTEVPSRRDDYGQPLTDCRAQRNLSVSGVSSAHDTGVTLRALEIPIARVITSPMCRSAETARYMFGINYDLDDRLAHHEPGGIRNLDVAEAEIRALIAELDPLPKDANVALVSHGGNIFRSTGLRLTEGEIGVLELGEDGEIIALGQLSGSALGFIARSQLASTAQD
ncbi:MAG: hypothetical protein MRY59_11255 [Aquisalinus sp.]|nr:hypothetical protein [Aquisalinus sp.]